ncbi:MAG: M64 family metallopeptidase [Pseudomonadota bacterium]
MNKFLSVTSILVFLSGCGGGGESGNAETGFVATNSNETSSALHSISATPITNTVEDESYRFNLSVKNPSDESLTYRLVNAPEWLSVDTTGVVSGIAQTNADTGTFRDISVHVADSQQRVVTLAPFDLTVTPVNDAPKITMTKQNYVVDGRSKTSIAFNFSDEESSYPDDVQLVGNNADILSVELLTNNEIEVTVADVESVTETALQVEFFDGNTSVLQNLEMTILPMTESGLGRTIRGSRNGAGIHLVVLGDGYTASQQDLFMQDALAFNAMFDNDPYIASHMSAWNIHMVYRESQESGADNEYGVDTTETFFDSGYSCKEITRLICANSSKVFAAALEEFPLVSQSVLVVNAEAFGGSGGNSLAVYNRTSPELAMHELGHSFANLADEYVDESISDYYLQFYEQGAFANVSNSENAEDAPWAHWIDDRNNLSNESGDQKVGLYEGAYFTSEGFYRPVYDSVMRTAGKPFGVVNAEQWILSIYSEVGAVTYILPYSNNISVYANNGANFSVAPTFGTPLQELKWFLDDVEIDDAFNKQSLALDLPVGTYTVAMQISDVSGKIRNPAKDISSNFTYEWQLTVK